MKGRRLIGLTLILSSILLQVGYAASVTTQTVARTDQFEMSIKDVSIQEQSGQIEVQTEIIDQGRGLNLKVSNLHPGSSFRIKANISNTGSLPSEVEKIEFKQIGASTPEADTLYQQLKGYDRQGTSYGPQAYEDFLQETYIQEVIEPGEEIPIAFGMQLEDMASNMQNVETEFQVAFTFRQETQPPDPPKPPDPPDPSEPDIDIPEEEVPGGPNEPSEPPTQEDIDIPEESVPGGSIDLSEPPTQEDIDISQEDIPGGSIKQLPKTGGITPNLVYGIGILMLGSGIILYRKK